MSEDLFHSSATESDVSSVSPCVQGQLVGGQVSNQTMLTCPRYWNEPRHLRLGPARSLPRASAASHAPCLGTASSLPPSARASPGQPFVSPLLGPEPGRVLLCRLVPA